MSACTKHTQSPTINKHHPGPVSIKKPQSRRPSVEVEELNAAGYRETHMYREWGRKQKGTTALRATPSALTPDCYSPAGAK